jgi:transcriptional regulator with XRE-family HTH domain
VPRVAIKPSATVAEFLRDLRRGRRLTLRDVERRSGEMGEVIPYSTLARMERGLIDPGIRRLHLLLRLYGVSLAVAGDLLDLELFGRVPRGDLADLEDRGVALWKQGKIKDAFRHLFAVRRREAKTAAEELVRQRALLAFAVAAGSLGRRMLAREIVDGLLAAPPHPDLAVAVFVEAAVCWHWLGGKQTALAFLERAERLAGSDLRERAWIAHLKTSVLVDLGDFAGAEAALETARRSYQRARDSWGTAKLFAAEVKLAFARGQPAMARAAAQAGEAYARRHRFARLQTLRKIEEGQALVLLGEPKEALPVLAAALSQAQEQEDPLAQFFAHYWRCQAFLTTKDLERARLERQSAEYFSRFVDDVTPEIAAIRGESKGGQR